MRIITGAVLAVLLTGCAGTTTVVDRLTDYPNPQRYGLRTDDPCIRCGEGWIFLNIDQTTDSPYVNTVEDNYDTK